MADEVIPVPLAEQTVPARDIVITAGLVIRGQLDTTVLSDALTELVKRWPKLGARLVCNKKVVISFLRPPIVRE